MTIESITLTGFDANNIPTEAHVQIENEPNTVGFEFVDGSVALPYLPAITITVRQ